MSSTGTGGASGDGGRGGEVDGDGDWWNVTGRREDGGGDEELQRLRAAAAFRI